MFVLGCDWFPLRVDAVKWVRPRFLGPEGEALGIPRERHCFSLERTKDRLGPHRGGGGSLVQGLPNNVTTD